jgi:aconitate hydratase
MLRRAKVVGKFVEFFGEGAERLSVPDRATIANMAPEYGATMGFFPVDETTCQYYLSTGRSPEQVDKIRDYFRAQGLFGIPKAGDIEYSQVLELDLSEIKPSVAGPKRPQDRINLYALKESFETLFSLPAADGGFGKAEADLGKRIPMASPYPLPAHVAGGGNQNDAPVPADEEEMLNDHPSPDVLPESAIASPEECTLGHGDVVIAAITSCTNTSNPGVMIAAGLVAKKALEKGLAPPPHVKTSLAPGSRVVTEYLKQAGLLTCLERIGFGLVGYGCTTCIGNSGPLAPEIERAIQEHDLVAASVLSGNRNFEARVHQAVKANFLMSPPLVVIFALAGRVNIQLDREPIGTGKDGRPVFLNDLWPSSEEIVAALGHATRPDNYLAIYRSLGTLNPLWDRVPAPSGAVYAWRDDSTYIQEPPFFKARVAPVEDILGARALAIFGDSVTTDHISPAGSIKPASPAGKYLLGHGVAQGDFNSYGARRGNHEVMMRGTFANVRIRNLMVPGTEGGITVHQPSGKQMAIYDASMQYGKERTPLVIFAGEEYGTGSSRDWAAKGTQLLGVKAVIAKSFERIHRSNLAGMGVLPLQFPEGVDTGTLGLSGDETFDLLGLDSGIAPRQQVRLVIHRAGGGKDEVMLTLRLDTPIEVDYARRGGILPFVLEQLLGA